MLLWLSKALLLFKFSLTKKFRGTRSVFEKQQLDCRNVQKMIAKFFNLKKNMLLKISAKLLCYNNIIIKGDDDV